MSTGTLPQVKPTVRFSDESTESFDCVPLNESPEKTNLSVPETDISTDDLTPKAPKQNVTPQSQQNELTEPDEESSDDEEERVIYKPERVEKAPNELGRLPERFKNAGSFQGYGSKIDALYRTTSSDYGSRPPTVLTMPSKYYGFTRKFTTHLSVCGMYRNHSVNSKLDK